MIEAILNSLCAVAVVAVVAGVGFYFAHKGTFNEQSRALIAKLVNISLPCFLFYSVAAVYARPVHGIGAKSDASLYRYFH